jgi:hypothetical protein
LGINLFAWDQQLCGSLGSNRLHGLAINPVEADAFSVLIVQNFEGVAVEDGDDGANKIGSTDANWNQ